MNSDQASRTAAIVCMARAIAHGIKGAGRFSDPTAFVLLGEADRQRVERHRGGAGPRGLAERFTHAHLAREASMIVARTIAVDDAFCEKFDEDLPAIGARVSSEMARATRIMRHLRIVAADRL